MNQSSIDLLFDLPPQLLQLLVICATPLRLAAQLSQAIRWSSPQGPWPSWTLLFAYWLICHTIPLILPYALPSLLLPLLLTQLVWPATTAPPPPAAIQANHNTHPAAVQQSLNHLLLIADHYALLSQQASAAANTINLTLCLTTLTLSILISRLIPLPSILFLAGALLILSSSPWFIRLSNLLNRSPLILLLKSLAADLLLHLRFQPLLRYKQFINPNHPSQSIISAISSLLSLKDNNHSQASSSSDLTQEIEFCLTIFENQRWWMGLDWTSNLLPHERPNWSDSDNQPVASPTTFKLPGPKEFEGVEGARSVVRKVEWSWVDPEWKLVDQKDLINTAPTTDHQPDSSLNSPSPSNPIAEKTDPYNPTPPQSPDLSLRRRSHNRSTSQTDSPGRTSSSTTLDSDIVLEFLRNSGLGTGLITGTSSTNGTPATLWEVDSNGWQYGDNHWEKMSKKSGIGRYTRRRAWTRKARLLSSIIRPTDLHPPADSSAHAHSPETVDTQPSSPSSSPPPSPRPSSSPLTVVDPPASTIIQPSSSSATTALSLNLKRSLGLLRRK